LRELNLLLEQLRVPWRLVEQRRWISQQQPLFANARLKKIEQDRFSGLSLFHGPTRKTPAHLPPGHFRSKTSLAEIKQIHALRAKIKKNG